MSWVQRLKRRVKVHFEREERARSSPKNFTPRAVQALALARKEAVALNHNFVGTEHVLLGLIRLGYGVAFNVLKTQCGDVEKIREYIAMAVGVGPAPSLSEQPPYTPRVRKALVLAGKEAARLNHTYVGTEHILLGLLEEGDGVAALVLKKFGADVEGTRKEILKEKTPVFVSEEEVKLNPAVGTETFAEYRENLTPRARGVLRWAAEESRRMNAATVDGPHLFLGLLRLDGGVSQGVLRELGLTLEAARAEADKQLGNGAEESVPTHLPYSEGLKRILVVSDRVAEGLNHTYIGTEHLLLAVLEEKGSGVQRLLDGLGVDRVKAREAVMMKLIG